MGFGSSPIYFKCPNDCVISAKHNGFIFKVGPQTPPRRPATTWSRRQPWQQPELVFLLPLLLPAPRGPLFVTPVLRPLVASQLSQQKQSPYQVSKLLPDLRVLLFSLLWAHPAHPSLRAFSLAVSSPECSSRGLGRAPFLRVLCSNVTRKVFSDHPPLSPNRESHTPLSSYLSL